MRAIRSSATSNAYTVTVTPSSWATRPGWPLTVRSRSVRSRSPARDVDEVARDLLAAFDRAERGADEAAAVGDHRGVGVEEADEGVDVLGFPRLLEVSDDARPAGRPGSRAPATARMRRRAEEASWRQAAGVRPTISATSAKE